MLIAGVSLLVSVLVLMSARWLYDHNHLFFLLCNACEQRLRRAAPALFTGSRGGAAGGRGIGPGTSKIRGAAAP